MDSVAALDKQCLWHPFNRVDEWCAADQEPLVIERGKGVWLWDRQGRRYIDGNSSIWTNIHGHGHPHIDSAIAGQLKRLAHSSFLGLTHEPAVRLASALVEVAGGGVLERVFFSDNGSTAIEVALRMAIQGQSQRGQGQRREVLYFDGAYHGDTLGVASLGAVGWLKAGLGPWGYERRCLSNADELEAITAPEAERVAALVIEPMIQGAGGMRLWPAGMLARLRRWCTAHGVWLIFDEVMTGFGRTGRMFAWQHENILPDLLCLAKGITGGTLPLAATLCSSEVFDCFRGEPQASRFLAYGHSYTANPLACAAALASLEVFAQEQVIQGLAAKQERLKALLALVAAHPRVLATRQLGMIGAFDLRGAAGEGAVFCRRARAHGLLTRPILNTVVVMPPLCTSPEEFEALETALLATLHEGGSSIALGGAA